jgi:hypothetical protein
LFFQAVSRIFKLTAPVFKAVAVSSTYSIIIWRRNSVLRRRRHSHRGVFSLWIARRRLREVEGLERSRPTGRLRRGCDDSERADDRLAFGDEDLARDFYQAKVLVLVAS